MPPETPRAAGESGDRMEVHSYSRATIPKDSRLDFAGTVLAEAVEGRLVRYYAGTTGEKPILLDFRDATYIDIAALVNCIATIVERRERSRVTLLGCPRAKRVRDFLKVWRFPEAVEAATRAPFRSVLLREDWGFLVEKQTSYGGYGDALDYLEYDPDWQEGSPTRRNFFEFATFSADEGKQISPEGGFVSAPRVESSRWTGILIRRVLAKHLADDSAKDDVARVIVYEAMSNAVRHPRARIIQAVSKFEHRASDSYAGGIGRPASRDRNEAESPRGTLRICIWDDGDAIPATLRPTTQGGKLRAFRLPAVMYDSYRVQLESFDGTEKTVDVVDESEDLPPEKMTEARLLLASLFPGVSRASVEHVPDTEPPEQAASQPDETVLSGFPGMGLYSLRRTALDQFQGSLFIRSGSHRLEMEVAHDAWRKEYRVRYKCTITSYPESFPPFRGNLIELRIPKR